MKPKFKTPGEAIDALWAVKQKLDKARAAVKVLEEEDSDLRDAVIKQFGVQKLAGARTGKAVCTITQPTVPSVENWDDVYGWVTAPLKADGKPLSKAVEKAVKTSISERLSIFQKRLSTELWRALLDAGQPVPGTKAFTPTRLSLTAVKGKARGK